MKLPNLKLNIKFKLTVGMVINPILILLILVEVYFAYSSLYKKLDPQPAEVGVNKIVKVDLPTYQATTDLIDQRQNYTPALTDLTNQNPFKYK